MTSPADLCPGPDDDGLASDNAILGGDAELLAKALEQKPGYKVLRQLDIGTGVDVLPPQPADERIGVVVDIETTGLDFVADRPIEISIQRFFFDADFQLTTLERPLSWLEDPGFVVPTEISRMTGIVTGDLEGRRFDDKKIVDLVADCEIFIAHNASFDRPFVDRRFPELQGNKWACSLTQIDWAELGFDGKSLGYLLMQAGWYFRGHRAQNDVVALTTLLRTSVSDGRTVLSHLLERSSAKTIRVDAVNAPFGVKDVLKGSGYRWDMMRRVWSREIREEDVAAETQWLDHNVYQGRGIASLHPVTAKERFRRPH